MADKKAVKKLGERYWEPEPHKPQRVRWDGAGEMPPGVSLGPSIGYVEFPAKEFETEWAAEIVAASPGFKVVKPAPKTKPAPPVAPEPGEEVK